MTDKEIEGFFKQWKKRTKRNGGVLIGQSIKELLIDFNGEIMLKSSANIIDENSSDEEIKAMAKKVFEKPNTDEYSVETRCYATDIMGEDKEMCVYPVCHCRNKDIPFQKISSKEPIQKIEISSILARTKRLLPVTKFDSGVYVVD